MVIERYKSGFQPPDAIPFDDLGNVSEQEQGGRSGSLTNLTPKTAVRGAQDNKGTTSGKKKKRGALQYIFGNAKVSGRENFCE